MIFIVCTILKRKKNVNDVNNQNNSQYFDIKQEPKGRLDNMQKNIKFFIQKNV